MRMPTLETERLAIRPFVMADLESAHQLLDVRLGKSDLGFEAPKSLAERERWLRWTVLSYEELAELYQPPYGDRAIVLNQASRIIGACGYVPCLGPFAQLPSAGGGRPTRLYSPELGLFYAVSPEWQGRGYASEAARALIDYAFSKLNLRRVVATTKYENTASACVMEKVGMRVERNPYADPPWFQVVGIVDNPANDP